LLLKSTPAPIYQLVKQINVLDAVNWIHLAKKKILPETVKKCCFLKAAFPAHALADTEDMYTSPVTLFINEISHKKVVVPRCGWLD
jgi:hypothetical protein